MLVWLATKLRGKGIKILNLYLKKKKNLIWLEICEVISSVHMNGANGGLWAPSHIKVTDLYRTCLSQNNIRISWSARDTQGHSKWCIPHHHFLKLSVNAAVYLLRELRWSTWVTVTPVMSSPETQSSWVTNPAPLTQNSVPLNPAP